MENTYYVYIAASASRVIYIGMTNNLIRRIWEHKQKCVSGFTQKYHVNRLVYYKATPDVLSAIGREKQIKGYRREKKVALIHAMNPEWRDLYLELTG